MATIPPLFIDGLSYESKALRRALQTLVVGNAEGSEARSGVTNPTSLVPYAEGNVVMVKPGGCVISSTDGMYLTGVDMATSAGTIPAADATHARRDLIVLEVLDPKNRGEVPTEREGRLRIVKGTATSTPSLPAYDKLSPYLKLGETYVPRSGAGAATVMGGPQMTAAAGGSIPVADKAERNAMARYVGLTVWRKDLGVHQTWNGARWLGVTTIRVAGTSSEGIQENWGVVTVNSDENGFFGWTYPDAFSTRTLAATITSGYQSSGVGAVVAEFDEALSSRTRAAFACYDLNGNLLRNTTNIRVVIHAIGD